MLGRYLVVLCYARGWGTDQDLMKFNQFAWMFMNTPGSREFLNDLRGTPGADPPSIMDVMGDSSAQQAPPARVAIRIERRRHPR